MWPDTCRYYKRSWMGSNGRASAEWLSGINLLLYVTFTSVVGDVSTVPL